MAACGDWLPSGLLYWTLWVCGRSWRGFFIFCVTQASGHQADPDHAAQLPHHGESSVCSLRSWDRNKDKTWASIRKTKIVHSPTWNTHGRKLWTSSQWVMFSKCKSIKDAFLRPNWRVSSYMKVVFVCLLSAMLELWLFNTRSLREVASFSFIICFSERPSSPRDEEAQVAHTHTLVPALSPLHYGCLSSSPLVAPPPASQSSWRRGERLKFL